MLKHEVCKNIRLWTRVWAVAALLAGFGGCADESEASYRPGSNTGGDDVDWGSDLDADGDMDTDSDTDTDSDADMGIDTDGGSEPPWIIAPETEAKFDYRIPVSSGQYVFIADAANDKVVVVDSRTLAIKMVETGAYPTHVVPLGDDGRAAVLATGSSEVTIIDVTDAGVISSKTVKVRKDTNALVPAANGGFLIAFWDKLFQKETGSPETNQDISILDLRKSTPVVYHTVIGMNPISISYNRDGDRAFAITETGIDIIELTEIRGSFIPDNVRLFNEPFIDPELVEIAIDPSGTVAIGRRDDSTTLTVAWLDGSGRNRAYELSSPPTDIDIAIDGSFGMVTLRHDKAVGIFQLPLPQSDTDDPFDIVSLGELNCGAATLFPDGSGAALYTTIAPELLERQLLTILKRDGDDWKIESRLLNRTIKSVVVAPDSASLLVHHNQYTSQPGGMNWSYTLVKLPGLQTKFQQLDIEPGQLLMTPDGGAAFLIVSKHPTYRVDAIDLGSFIVDTVNLGSPPTSLGYAVDTDKVFISQYHPSGRMTFLNLQDDSVKTVTGFVLNNEITN